LHRDLLFAAHCIGDCVTIESALGRQVVERLVKIYLDPTGAGKYRTLRARIAEALNYLRNSESANEAAEVALAALRDEKSEVRGFAAWALGEVSKDRKSELPQRLSHQIADTLRDMFDDPSNQERDPISAGGWYFTKPVDAFWEALWLMCRRMDEQRV
jgi:hypothetical protein